ncbi:glycosyltransferase family 2 protein [Neomicrococcus lactis]|uniref:Glycosyltransferase involved in cell wall biosynthesis n=1 Tax=Neomicrococcus lactis TaxID=732241 RepID=A0A7W8YAZ3_9MICC|nr:glycosyltransferase [Neomicrococcus lactis]MBB5598181.1 glycosyltransferase involved in cell wall biosynthesis [Neomicrococcus lactis]
MTIRAPRPVFSVIVPTLLRAEELQQLVQDCEDHPLVLEVLVINNATDPLSWNSPKVRVLQQQENIYVNPAWDLVVRESRGKYLAILNDDVLFNPKIFTFIAKWLGVPGIGIIGPNNSCLIAPNGQPILRPTNERPTGWGIAMFMRRDAYTAIPEELRVFYGDDWLFRNSPRTNWTHGNYPIPTEMSVTSGDPKFNPIIAADDEVWRNLEFSPSKQPKIARIVIQLSRALNAHIRTQKRSAISLLIKAQD